MKNLIVVALTAGLIALGYYLFFRPFEFEVRFRAETVPGDIIQSLRIWTRSLEGSNIVKVDSFNHVMQVVSVDQRTYKYNWRFDPASDSVTIIRVRISERDRNILNKLLIPFTDQNIEKDAAIMVREFYDILSTHLDITRVRVIGESRLDSVFCICSTLQTNQIEKANGMMLAYSPLTTFVSEYNLEVAGRPMVRVNSWSHSMGSLAFDFCFPIKKTGDLPQSKIFSYKEFPQQRALKAEYFGNYITSDRAWYELIKFAHNNDYKTTGFPIELFHNNPNLGSNEKDWKAEIFLPLEDTFRKTEANDYP